MRLSIIVAMSADKAIGYEGRLPWHIPEDLARFKAITYGHTIIMGRKTFESLPHGALPGRRNIVLSRRQQPLDGCEVFGSLSEALGSCEEKAHLPDGDDEVFVIGGASVYRQALPMADKLYLTLVDCRPPRADTFFPSFDKTEWRETKKEKHDGFSFMELERRRGAMPQGQQ